MLLFESTAKQDNYICDLMDWALLVICLLKISSYVIWRALTTTVQTNTAWCGHACAQWHAENLKIKEQAYHRIKTD